MGKIEREVLAVLVTDANLRTAVIDEIDGLASGPAGYLTLDTGHGRGVIYSGPLPAGVDKHVRVALASINAKVSTVRNLSHQQSLWNTLIGVKSVKAEYTAKTPTEKMPPADKVKSKAKSKAKTPEDVIGPAPQTDAEKIADAALASENVPQS